ncbi:MAG: SusC/RagA family TonB-linked outer membrane protein [Dysgonamonadaceae bacterium]|jgi:TonB-linked SusC/RagA family outer membrane protein|nr:SusC/RagA family TonB-linked outer membrane protein [Dysgonamonadaceae bacterium]
MKRKLLYIFLIMFSTSSLWAQEGETDAIRGKVVSDLGEELMSVAVLEIDKTDRIISHSMTDINGHFSMQIKSSKNRLKFTYIGFDARILEIGTQKVFNITLKENSTLKEVIISAKRTATSGGMEIPVNEISFAMQRISTKDLEGLQITSIEDALQGQIAGLDIVGNGNIGGGASMRIRGTASITGNSDPLIVINGIPRDDISTSDVDFSSMNDQQLGDLLSVHPDDILDITVLKDAGATAVWGSKGAGGVLLITLKKGIPGATRINYTYKTLFKKQPEGLKMLNGDNYTMMMKEAMFNRQLAASSIPEFDYLTESQFSESRYFSGNTDWRKAVTQTGVTHDHYLALSGGGEKASFRITGSYVKETGTIIQQELQRFTTNVVLDYNISSRIMFGSEFLFTYADQDRNWSDGRDEHDYINGKGLLDIAYKKMPNLSIYDANGDFYHLQKISLDNKSFPEVQKWMRNPVALAELATNKLNSYKINPLLRLQYDFFDPNEQMLRLKSYVTFNMNDDNVHKFLPKELYANSWNNQDVNRADDHRSKSVSTKMEASLQWNPKFENKDNSLLIFGSFYSESTNSNTEDIITSGLPAPLASSAPGYREKVASGISQGRAIKMSGQVQYAYQSKYIAYLTLTREGSTRFGSNRKFGNFPSISLRWNIADESFMDFSNKWLDVFSLRPSWGVSGNMPRENYLHYSQYVPNGMYGMYGTIRPENLRLTNLQWERKTGINLGTDFAFLDYIYTADFNIYHERSSDLLLEDALIPTSSGYEKLNVRNTGVMDNDGWEVNVQGNKFVKAGNFSMDFTFNIANSLNTLVRMNPDILELFNQPISYNRDAQYIGRAEVGLPYGSIYGYRYKGVYQYNIESYTNPEVKALVDAGKASMPVARNADGDIIFQSNGQPLPMMYNQGKDGKNYKFQGGDAIYEDINHDGNIDELDLVYLGNSNPKFYGGFSLTFRWKQLSVKSFFNYRYGNQVVNQARREAENMDKGNNQSIAVNWRWRTEGDERPIPRALYEDGYNWLPSSRFVEDASFLRFKYLTVNYTVPTAFLRTLSLRQLSLYMTFTNILCFTKYQGLDPEVEVGDFAKERGISFDKMTTPRSMDIMFGVNIGF